MTLKLRKKAVPPVASLGDDVSIVRASGWLIGYAIGHKAEEYTLDGKRSPAYYRVYLYKINPEIQTEYTEINVLMPCIFATMPEAQMAVNKILRDIADLPPILASVGIDDLNNVYVGNKLVGNIESFKLHNREYELTINKAFLLKKLCVKGRPFKYLT
jgi:hypothetical protein